MLQNCDAAAGWQSLLEMTEADISSSCVRSLLTSEINGLAETTEPLSQLTATSVVSNASPVSVSDPLLTTDLATLLEELLNILAVHGNDSATSGTGQNLPSDILTERGMSADSDIDDSSTAETFNRIVKRMIQLKNSPGLSSLVAKQSMSGSDSGHDDSNSLPPDMSGEIVIGNITFPSLTDAHGSSADSSLSTNFHETGEKWFNHAMKQLRALETAELSVAKQACSVAKQSVNGSDGGHDDPGSLLPNVSGEIVDVKDTVVQNGADGSRDEAAISSLNANLQKTADLTEDGESILKPPLAIVQPSRTAIPEFVAQGT